MAQGKTFKLNKENYNKEFAYLNNNGLKFKGLKFSIDKGFQMLNEERIWGNYKGKFVVFTTFKALQKLKENPHIKTTYNDKSMYIAEAPNFRFVNFNKVANVARVEQIKEKYGIYGEDELDLMENFIKFLKSLGASELALSTKWLTGIQREIFYKGLDREDLNFKEKKFNVMRSSTPQKRKFVFDYLKTHCEDSGILDTTVGTFENVISIDMSSMYPYIMIAFMFMVEDPYPYFYRNETYGGTWDYFPITFRRHIIDFYKKKSEGIAGKFYKLCLNSLNGKSISDYEVKRANTDKNNFLAPQHGFQVIEIGRQILENMTKKLRLMGCKILERDTDSIKFLGDIERVRELIDNENQQIIRRLVNSGLTFGEATCGIGQWRLEYQAEMFIQESPKHYHYCVNGNWVYKGERDETFTVEIGGEA